MFGRIFGRGKDEPDEAVCAECGRTLLAGEWTQKVRDGNGEERLICSLCGQAHPLGGGDPLEPRAERPESRRVTRVVTPPAEEGAPPAEEGAPLSAAAPGALAPDGPTPDAPEVATRSSRSESDAFWKALKEKDATIERLEAELARAEAERQELAGQLAALRGQGAAGDVTPEPPTGDASEPGERTWGETPAEFASEMAALQDEAAAVTGSTPAPEASAAGPEDTLPIEPPEDALPPEPAAEAAAPDMRAAAGVAAGGVEAAAEARGAEAPEAVQPTEAGSPATPEGESVAEQVATGGALTLLQRGVDLLNVSRVPRKIAETNEQLGLPQVHVASDGENVSVTFLWSMGWYEFRVDENGGVRLRARGYEDRPELRPNAAVRADGTVQLAPAQISRAAAQRAEPAPEAEPAPQAPPPRPAEPESASDAAQKPPEILSKSLLGQRSDDEPSSWEGTKARDFDWDR